MPAQKLDRLLKLPILGRIVGRKVLAGLGLDAVRYALCGAAPVPGRCCSGIAAWAWTCSRSTG